MDTRTSIPVTACSNLEVEGTVYSESNKITLKYRNTETNLNQFNLSIVVWIKPTIATSYRCITHK